MAQNFSHTFAKLVPGGKASLLIQKRSDGGASQDSQDGEQSRISQYTGIAIRVSFSGIDSEAQMMQQLSGGQKSVVALALIFAIQKCDPAPFYLFDEIDSALDSTHRAAVADLIKEFSETGAEEKAQFIVSTFRPEIVQKAHKWYGVSYQNKESSIGPISRDAALKIIQEEAEQEVTGGREESEGEAE